MSPDDELDPDDCELLICIELSLDLLLRLESELELDNEDFELELLLTDELLLRVELLLLELSSIIGIFLSGVWSGIYRATRFTR